jgi:hypothetical protein
MTPEERYDRLERIAGLLYKAADNSWRKSRQQVKLLLELERKWEERLSRETQKLPNDPHRDDR